MSPFACQVVAEPAEIRAPPASPACGLRQKAVRLEDLASC
jgi:hypothetical protein